MPTSSETLISDKICEELVQYYIAARVKPLVEGGEYSQETLDARRMSDASTAPFTTYTPSDCEALDTDGLALRLDDVASVTSSELFDTDWVADESLRDLDDQYLYDSILDDPIVDLGAFREQAIMKAHPLLEHDVAYHEAQGVCFSFDGLDFVSTTATEESDSDDADESPSTPAPPTMRRNGGSFGSFTPVSL